VRPPRREDAFSEAAPKTYQSTPENNTPHPYRAASGLLSRSAEPGTRKLIDRLPEGERLLDVADFQGDVVDSNQLRHGAARE
jgi:hypothetical protein